MSKETNTYVKKYVQKRPNSYLEIPHHYRVAKVRQICQKRPIHMWKGYLQQRPNSFLEMPRHYFVAEIYERVSFACTSHYRSLFISIGLFDRSLLTSIGFFSRVLALDAPPVFRRWGTTDMSKETYTCVKRYVQKRPTSYLRFPATISSLRYERLKTSCISHSQVSFHIYMTLR